MTILKKEKDRIRKGKEATCLLCDETRIVRLSNNSKLCRKCAYTVNAFKINSYIIRPPRGKDGKYKAK